MVGENPKPPTDDETKAVCKLGQAMLCCRFLAMGPDGWSCLKLTSLRGHIDERVARGTFNARGDNCDGKGD